MSTLNNVSKKTVPVFLLIFMLFATILTCTVEPANAIPPGFTGVIRINVDGSVSGTDKISQNGNVYTLTGDITGNVEDGFYFISIEKDGVVFDGAGKTIQGSNTGTAITALGRTDLTIKNTRIVGFGTGIELRQFDWDMNTSAANNRVLDNYFETRYWGIDYGVNNGVVSGNTFVSKTSLYGVILQANQTIFINNVFQNGGLILNKPGVQNVFSGNTINGKPLVYLEGQSNQVVDDASQVVLVNCQNMVVKNIDDLGLRQPIQLFGTTGSTVTNCKTSITLTDSNSNTLTGNEFKQTGTAVNYNSAAIELQKSYNNTVTQNTIKAVGCNGIHVSSSSYNKILKNTITSSGFDYSGIRLELAPCEYNYVYENSITSEAYGVFVSGGAKNNVIFKNTISQCRSGVLMSGVSLNSFLANNISGASEYAVTLSASDFNSFFYNTFEGNTKVNESHKIYWWGYGNDTYYAENNLWDDGKEGNYWSDYTGVDADGDGIGETPYHVYENFTDHYPLTEPYDASKVQVNFKEWIPQVDTTRNAPSTQQNKILLLSPMNTTYSSSSVNMEFVTSTEIKSLFYQLDGQNYVAISGNITLTDLAAGTHRLAVVGNTAEGTPVISKEVYFTVSSLEDTFPVFPTVAIMGTVVAAGAVSLWYFKKLPKTGLT
jgi:parallel beta-helix repeat protein